MDSITIKDLEVPMHIGVTAREREHSQRLLISLVLERDLGEAGRTDMESATTGYDAVINLVKQLLAQRPRKLIEAVANEVAEAVLSRRLAVAVTVPGRIVWKRWAGHRRRAHHAHRSGAEGERRRSHTNDSRTETRAGDGARFCEAPSVCFKFQCQLCGGLL